METLTLTELGARIARRWRTLLVAVLAGTTLGVAVHAAVPTRYEATTLVSVDAADPTLVDMAAEEAIATSRRVTAEALDALGSTRLTIRALEDATAARAVDGSRLLRITVAAGTPLAATRGADAVAHAYLAARSVDAARDVDRPAVEGTVVDPARAPRSPIGPGLAASALAGALLGLLLVTPVAAGRGRSLSRTRAARAS